MTRRANLPGADELFRSTTPALTSVPTSGEASAPLVPPTIATPKAPSVNKGVRDLKGSGQQLLHAVWQSSARLYLPKALSV